MKGKFIIIEGTDGSGKTTQLQLLKEWFENRGNTVKVVDFPQYDEFWGKLVGRFLKGEFGELDEISPYLVSPLYILDQNTQSKKIRQWIKEGHIVLSNRYVTSSMAHQTCKFEEENDRRKYLEWLVEAAYKQIGLIKEDLTIVLFVDPEISSQLSLKARARKGKYTAIKDIAEENRKHQRDSAKMYKHLTETFEQWKLLNCMKEGSILPKEVIHKMVVELISESFEIADYAKQKNTDKSQLALTF